MRGCRPSCGTPPHTEWKNFMHQASVYNNKGSICFLVYLCDCLTHMVYIFQLFWLTFCKLFWISMSFFFFNCSFKNELNSGISSMIPMKVSLFEESHSSLQYQKNKIFIRKQLFLAIKILLYFFVLWDIVHFYLIHMWSKLTQPSSAL